jgi:hypothetical protein
MNGAIWSLEMEFLRIARVDDWDLFDIRANHCGHRCGVGDVLRCGSGQTSESGADRTSIANVVVTLMI